MSKRLHIGSPVWYRYRGEKHATGTIIGIAKPGKTPADTKWKLRSTTNNATKGKIFEHYGRILHLIPKRRRS